MVIETTTSDGCETFVHCDDNHPSAYRGYANVAYATYVSTTDDRHRVVITYDPHCDQEGPFGWDTWLSCYGGNDLYHHSINLWRRSQSYDLPTATTLMYEWRSLDEFDDDELREDFMPAGGIVIGLDYSGGSYLAVNPSPNPRDWDGYFHITERHWLALMGNDRRGRTYTEREATLRAGLEGLCKTVTDWINGDVFAWRLEHREHWTSDQGAERDTWEVIEAVGGYYGDDDRTIEDMIHEAFGCRKAVAA